MNLLIAIVGILIAAALQVRMPTLWWLGGVRMEFLPPLVAYVSFTMHRRRAVVLALIAGMMQDALSAAPFGVSALAYGIAALLMTSLRDALDRDLPSVQLGASALTSAAAAIIAFFVVGFSFGAIFKMVVVASISGILAVILFFVLDYTRMAWGNA